MVGSLVEYEAERLARYTRQAGESDEPVDPFKPVSWMTELAETVEDTFRQLRSRIDYLSVRRRDLEVEARVAQTDRRYGHAILETLDDAVLVTDAFNELVMANRAAARLFGFDTSRAVGVPVDQALGDPLMAKLIGEARQGWEAQSPRRFEHVAGHGANARSCTVTLAPVINDQGESCGVVAVLGSDRQGSASADLSREFVSGVSHELRTPLSSIRAYIEMLVDGEAADEAIRQEFYNIIQSETLRLSRLVDNILNISRIESGVAQAQREEVSLPRLVREVIDVMAPQARAAQVSLSENVAPQPVRLMADRDLLYQALLNLVSNAVKYTRPGGRVTVETTVDEDERWVEVAVSDTGVGVPVADQARLFDKFYRVDSHKKYAKGSGLGLNLVRHVVETLHEGRITLTSRQGSGSTFRVRLPLAEAPAETCATALAYGATL
ncbi:MAG: sensor histidine kinase, partial [Planctomycetota bacterium]|jgi:PAS domain S-box-containing protein